MKRCPKCDATYDADAAWCPVDGARLEDALHTLMEDPDADAGHTLRDIPVSQLTQAPGALTMGWEIPDVAEDPPRTTPTQLAAMGAPMVPTTFAGVPTPPTGGRPRRETSSLKAATLPPAAPRMTPQTLAAALARAPSPHRAEPISTPTSINVPTPPAPSATISAQLPIETPTSISAQLPIETPTSMSAELPSVSALMASVSALLPSQAAPPSAEIPVEVEPADEPVPAHVQVRRTAPMASVAPVAPTTTTLAPRSATPSVQPPTRRLITQPMQVVLAEPAPPVPVIEVLPHAPESEQMQVAPPMLEMTAPVAQVSVELRVPITMPGVVPPPLRTSQEQRAPRKPPSPSDAPPMGDAFAVPSQLAQPSGPLPLPPPARSSRWMWIAIALIAVGGAIGTIVALQ